MPTRDDDLATLKLAPGTYDTNALKKAYHRESLQCHPDKGGTKEAFQKLTSAHERLQAGPTAYIPKPQPRPSSSTAAPAQNLHNPFDDGGFDSDGDNEDFGFHSDYNWSFDFEDFFDFFRTNTSFSSFDKWYLDPKLRAKKRKEDAKKGIDYRDRVGKPSHLQCDTCGVRDGIVKSVALKEGVNWNQYIAHPLKRKTCWNCKTIHKSVMTMNQAQRDKRFKNLPDSFFMNLKRKEKFFSARPVAKSLGRPTRQSDYYWVADFPVAAIASAPPTPSSERSNANTPLKNKGPTTVMPPTPTKSPKAPKQIKSDSTVKREVKLEIKRDVKTEVGSNIKREVKLEPLGSPIKAEVKTELPIIRETKNSYVPVVDLTTDQKAIPRISKRTITRPIVDLTADSDEEPPNRKKPKLEYNWDEEAYDLRSDSD
ncbi:hypothetical protein HDU99_004038 [Rhizoclosmatium hyalinum]|nr:hypothetical protein HDU99_004038 [Rhizoclosmatium hyalinum]